MDIALRLVCAAQRGHYEFVGITMSVINCEGCKTPISKKAKESPGCGRPNKKSDYLSGGQSVLALSGAGLFLWFLFGCFSEPSPTKAPASSEPPKEYPEALLSQGSIICYERDDWDLLKESALDKNCQRINNLIKSGECQEITSRTVVRYLDPVGEDEALIQMPSGRGAVSMRKDLRAL